MTTSGLCKRIRQGTTHDVVWQQIQYAGDDLLQLNRDVRPKDGELLTELLGELGPKPKTAPRFPSCAG